MHHTKYEQFVVNPLFAASIGYKMKKLILKPDTEPTLFDFSKPINSQYGRNWKKKSLP
jgi:hypothetical protein